MISRTAARIRPRRGRRAEASVGDQLDLGAPLFVVTPTKHEPGGQSKVRGTENGYDALHGRSIAPAEAFSGSCNLWGESRSSAGATGARAWPLEAGRLLRTGREVRDEFGVDRGRHHCG